MLTNRLSIVAPRRRSPSRSSSSFTRKLMEQGSLLRRLAMAALLVLMMLTACWSSPLSSSAPATARGGVDLGAAREAAGTMGDTRNVPVAPEAYHLGPHGSDQRWDAVTADYAETKIINSGVKRKLRALHSGYQKKLKIAVPWKGGFKAFVNVTDRSVSGYCIDVFEATVKKLPQHLTYEFAVFNGSYDDLVWNVSSGSYDAAVGDITITAERASHVDFTMPYTESGVSLLVLTVNDSKSTIEWIFLKPLTWQLWSATVVFFLYTALVIWLIERPRNLEYQGPRSRQCSTALYFSFSTLTFSHGQIIKSPMSKIVVVVWCFVVLVLVQSYTASFSSILTAKRLRPSVTDLDQLLFNGDYVGCQDESFVCSLLKKRGFSERRIRPYKNKQEYAEALRKGSKFGGVSAIVDEIPYLTTFLSDPLYQEDFQMLKRIYKTPGFGFVFPSGFPLVHNLSTAILNVTGGDEGSRIEAKWFGTSDSPSYGVPDADSSTPLTLRSFSGLFIITGFISAFMLLISISKLVLAKYAQIRYPDMQSDDIGDGGREAHGESYLAHNGMGGSVSDQPHREITIDDLQGIPGRVQNAGSEEPGLIQNGSMPENSAHDR